MNYREEMTRSMTMLGEKENTIFLGQSVLYKGTAMFGTLKGVDDSKKIELPVVEEMQMGISIGLALEGFIPVSLYPRMDFLICAMNQLVNHLDKIWALSEGRFNPKVIIRTSVGSREQLDPGLQHIGDYYEELESMLQNVKVVYLDKVELIYPAYEKALNADYSTVLIELGRLYD